MHIIPRVHFVYSKLFFRKVTTVNNFYKCHKNAFTQGDFFFRLSCVKTKSEALRESKWIRETYLFFLGSDYLNLPVEMSQ